MILRSDKQKKKTMSSSKEPTTPRIPRIRTRHKYSDPELPSFARVSKSAPGSVKDEKAGNTLNEFQKK
jgi:hypothetical protein